MWNYKKTTFLIHNFGREKFLFKKCKNFPWKFFIEIFLDDETEKKSVEHFVTTLTKCLALAFGHPEVHQNPKTVPKFKILEPRN